MAQLRRKYQVKEHTLSIENGKVTFTPEPDFVGKATGVTVKRVDKNGTPVTAKYTPTVRPDTSFVDKDVTHFHQQKMELNQLKTSQDTRLLKLRSTKKEIQNISTKKLRHHSRIKKEMKFQEIQVKMATNLRKIFQATAS